MEEVIAERKFVLEATRDRVWNLIGRVVLGNMPGLERIEVIDETNIRGLLKVRVAFVTFPMHLQVKVVEFEPPRLFGVLLSSKSKWGIIGLNQRATFILNSVNTNKTEVVCKSVAEGMGTLFRLIALWRVKSLATETLNSIEERLKQIA